MDKRFSYFTLQLMVSGSLRVAYPDSPPQVLDGAWLWMAWPGLPLAFRSARTGRSWNHRYIAFEGPAAAAWAGSGLLMRRPCRVDNPRDLTAFRRDFDEMLGLFALSDRWGPRLAANRLQGLLLRAAAVRSAEETRMEPWLSTVLTELESWDSEPDYAVLARRQGVSLPTLRRRFRGATGLALHTYRLEAKVSAARRLLGETDEPIKAIAERLGYPDVHYFTRRFTAMVGVPPGRYRASRQA